MFQPLPAGHDPDEFDGGEETTELGADVSDLVEDANPTETVQEVDTNDVEDEVGSVKSNNNNTTDQGLLSSLIPWL